MSSRRITIRVDETLEQEILLAARQKGVKPSRFIRDSVVKQLRGARQGLKESAHDAAVRTGILGAFPGFPKDLSTNKTYFKGFGK